MAIGTVFRDISMFEDERTLFFHMAPGTGLLGGAPLEQLVLGRTMGVMAIVTGHLFFHDRMVRKETVLHFYFGMAPVTKLGHFVPAYLLLRSLMKLVAIEATDVIKGMGAGIPVGKCRDGGS